MQERLAAGGNTLKERVGGVLQAIVLGRPTAAEQVAAETLRRDVAQLPPVPDGSTPEELTWANNRKELRANIAEKDPRLFLRWPVVYGAMVEMHERYTSYQLPLV